MVLICRTFFSRSIFSVCWWKIRLLIHTIIKFLDTLNQVPWLLKTCIFSEKLSMSFFFDCFRGSLIGTWVKFHVDAYTCSRWLIFLSISLFSRVKRTEPTRSHANWLFFITPNKEMIPRFKGGSLEYWQSSTSKKTPFWEWLQESID